MTSSEAPIRVGVTGGWGMLGWHLRCYFKQYSQYQLKIAGRETFGSEQSLAEFVRGTDVIVHLAGVNRGTDAELTHGNIDPAVALTKACQREACIPHVIYTSTIHAEHDTVYGLAKRQVGEIFRAWAEDSEAYFTELVLPHVFGEQTRPEYNSVTATFAWQLANGKKSTINRSAELELIHAQDVCADIHKSIDELPNTSRRISGKKISVGAVYDKLSAFSRLYGEQTVPNVDERLDLNLFNLYRSYLYPERYPRAFDLRADDRGFLFESLRTQGGGQVFYSTTHPGVTRGNHFHYRKIERFAVVSGRAEIKIRRLFSDDVRTFEVSGEQPVYIDMPTLHTHNITNTGKSELITMFWSNELFDPEHPDTIFEPVELIQQ